MCCRVEIKPLDRELAVSMLTVGQFVPGVTAGMFTRLIPEEDTNVTANINEPTCLSLALSPAVTAYVDHHDKRKAAGVMLEMAARYAEKVGGTIEQVGVNVPACQAEGKYKRYLGEYPTDPFGPHFDRLCPGWQEEFTSTGGNDEQDD